MTTSDSTVPASDAVAALSPRTVATEHAPDAIGPYSQAVVCGGLVYCSGQLPLDPSSGKPVPGSVAVQTRRVIDNLAEVLKTAGSSLGLVLKTTVYLTDLNDFPEMNDAYQEQFGHTRPARVTIGVAGLPLGAGVEIDCVAVTYRELPRGDR